MFSWEKQVNEISKHLFIFRVNRGAANCKSSCNSSVFIVLQALFAEVQTFVKALANDDTLLPTQMFPRLSARATFFFFFAADTNFDFVQKHFVSATNVSQETS